MNIEQPSVGMMLAQRRKAKGLTQEELSKRAEMNRGYLSKIETGSQKPSEELLAKLAFILEMDLGELTETFYVYPDAAYASSTVLESSDLLTTIKRIAEIPAHGTQLAELRQLPWEVVTSLIALLPAIEALRQEITRLGRPNGNKE